ncbi:MAG: ATP-binding cassette domain-containing protein, partial [bacterium]
MTPDPVLDVQNVTLAFGGLVAVDDFSMTLGEGELVGLIGPNGAGKTTIFNI